MSKRTIYLRVDQVRRLDHWCHVLALSFGRTAYLVGSVLERPDWRDVDVRLIAPDEVVQRLPMDRLDLNMLLSEWGQRQTDLPIDCQLQTSDEAAEYDGTRNPRGFLDADRRKRPTRKTPGPRHRGTPGPRPPAQEHDDA